MKTITLNPPSGTKMNLKLSAFFATLCCLLAGLFFQPNSAQAQTAYALNNCSAGDVRIIRVELVSTEQNPEYHPITNPNVNKYQPLPTSCTNSELLSGYLKITLDQNAGTRYGMRIEGDIFVDGEKTGAFGSCDANEFVKDERDQIYVDGSPITWTCGTQLEIKRIFIGWGNSETQNACQIALGAIGPHCFKGSLDAGITVVTPLNADFNATGSCPTGKTIQTWAFDASHATNGTTGGTLPYPANAFSWEIKRSGEEIAIANMTGATSSYDFSQAGAGPGSYTVTLTVTDDNPSATSSRSKEITVLSCCTPSTQPTGVSATPFTICNGSSSTLTPEGGSLGTGGSWKWYTDADFTVSAGTAEDDGSLTVSPTSTTTYYVRAEGECGISEGASVTVTVNAAPNAGTDGTLTVCAGTTLNEAMLLARLGGSPDPGGTWSPELAGAGTYTYTVNGTSPCAAATAQVTVIEQAAPNAGTNGTLTVCAGTTLNEAMLLAVLNGSPGGTWTPTLPALAGAGTYTYTVAATSPCSDAATAQVVVTVDPASQAAISFTGNSTVCSGNNSGTINVTSRTGNIERWESSTDGRSWDTYTQAGTSSSFVFSNLTQTTRFRVVVQSGVCAPANSNVILITVNTCAITYTQGYYGNANGSSCDGTNPVATTRQLLLTKLLSTAAGPLVIGRNGNTITIPNTTAGVDKLISILPGGGTANRLVHTGDMSITMTCPKSGSCFDRTYLSSGKINNVLLSQTIALGLNLRNSASLGSIKFVAGRYGLSTAATTGCPQTAIAGARSSCFAMSKSVIDFLFTQKADPTIEDLYDLANRMLSGNINPTNDNKLTYANVNATVDAINRGFDQGRMFLGFTDCGRLSSITQHAKVLPELSEATTLSVDAAPNPFQDRITFRVNVPEAGYGNFVLYNMLGQKVKVLFQGQLQAGVQTFEYRVPGGRPTGGLMYLLNVDNKQVSGKLLQARK